MRVFECSSGNPFQQSLCFFVPLGGLRKALVKRVYAINDRVYRERKRKPYRWVAPQKKKRGGDRDQRSRLQGGGGIVGPTVTSSGCHLVNLLKGAPAVYDSFLSSR